MPAPFPPLSTTLLTAALLALASCAKEEAAPVKVTPTVRVFGVGKLATGQSRRISGRVEALEQSALSFGVSGKITEIAVKEGQEVVEGQLIAKLDGATLSIAADEAATQVTQARAALAEARSDYDRTKTLKDKKGASQQELDVATAALANADGQLAAAESGVARAQIDLGRTRLVAPFAGRVVTIEPDAFQEVSGAETIAIIQAESALKVDVLVPESMIRSVEFGQAVQVTSPTVAETTFPATVSRIAADASDGNAFLVTVELAGTPADLRPGVTASVTFNFDAYLEGQTAYLIPLSSIAVDIVGEKQNNKAPVFVFDPTTESVNMRSVTIGNLHGNEVEILDGLELGDLVVSAGVAFVRDGMPAQAWTPSR